MEIKINSLSYSYSGNKVLSNLSLKIRQGDFLAIVGHNGSGKSTFVKCLLNINEVKKNVIMFDNIDINDYRKWTNFGYVPQKFTSFNYEFPISVNEVIFSCAAGKNKQHRVDEVLKLLNITELKNININNLSGGQIQRVFIARSLINDPKVLILDEPTVGLDTYNVHSLFQVLDELNKKGITIILITHFIDTCSCRISHVLSLTSKGHEFKTRDQYNNKNLVCEYC